jgi:hypothetical protein
MHPRARHAPPGPACTPTLGAVLAVDRPVAPLQLGIRALCPRPAPAPCSQAQPRRWPAQSHRGAAAVRRACQSCHSTCSAVRRTGVCTCYRAADSGTQRWRRGWRAGTSCAASSRAVRRQGRRHRAGCRPDKAAPPEPPEATAPPAAPTPRPCSPAEGYNGQGSSMHLLGWPLSLYFTYKARLIL